MALRQVVTVAPSRKASSAIFAFSGVSIFRLVHFVIVASSIKRNGPLSTKPLAAIAGVHRVFVAIKVDQAGLRDALVQQPGVQLVVVLHPLPWCEEALGYHANLVLHVALLPGNGIDQMMRARLQEEAIVLPVVADERTANSTIISRGKTDSR
jgi:hypothetical protein